jgi:hypothetical protein
LAAERGLNEWAISLSHTATHAVGLVVAQEGLPPPRPVREGRGEGLPPPRPVGEGRGEGLPPPRPSGEGRGEGLNSEVTP